MTENYTDPLSKLTDPNNLKMKQFTRSMTHDTTLSIFFFSAIITPIILAFALKDISQIWKIIYLPAAFFSCASLFNIQPTKKISTMLPMLIGFALPTILAPLIPALIVNYFSPEPSLFILVIPLHYFLYWYTQRWVPRSNHLEWLVFKKNTGMSDTEIEESLKRARAIQTRNSSSTI